MIKNLAPVKTVVIDAGHGGQENGAGSVHGLEKDFALDVALRLRTLLDSAGYNTVMTRDRDVSMELQERAAIANRYKDQNAIFVSIHFNGAANTSAWGAEIFSLTPRGMPSTNDDEGLQPHHVAARNGTKIEDASFALSSAIHHSVAGNLSQFDRGIKRARFAVLHLTEIPAVLIEAGFLTNPLEGRMIATPAWRAKLATSIFQGIDGYKMLAESGQSPKLMADYRRKLPTKVGLRDTVTAPPAAMIPMPSN